MLRFVRQLVNEEEDFPTSTELNTTGISQHDSITTPWIELLENNNTNSTNGSILAFSSSSNQQGFSWEFNWNFILVLASGLLCLILLISAGIWYWCNRAHRLRHRHSLPLAINDFIETTKIQEKRLSSSPTKAPPVPPRPTAYTSILGKVEYRSNL